MICTLEEFKKDWKENFIAEFGEDIGTIDYNACRDEDWNNWYAEYLKEQTQTLEDDIAYYQKNNPLLLSFLPNMETLKKMLNEIEEPI